MLQLEFRQQYSDTQMGVLYGCYALAATLLVLFSGPFIDRFGVRIATVFFSSMCFLGFGLQTIGTYVDSFALLVIGRFLYGGGGESLFVCWDTVITTWFSHSGLTLAISFYCASGRMGDIFVTLSLPSFISLLGGKKPTMLFALGCVFFALMANIGLVAIDYWKRIPPPVEPKTGSAGKFFSMEALKSFTKSYWICVAIAVVCYGTISQEVQFIPTIAEKLFSSPVVASSIMVVTYISALILTFLGGFFLNNERKFVAVLAASIALFVSCALLLVPSAVAVVISLLMLGTGYALTSSGLWGTIGMYQTGTNMGLLYSIPYAGFNFYGFVVALISGALLDHFPAWITICLWSVISAVGIVFCVLWMKFR